MTPLTTDTKWDISECNCIALRHDHAPNDCKRKAKVRGGICQECNYWTNNHETAPTMDESISPS